MGRFVQIEIAASGVDDAQGRAIAAACPVDIFAHEGPGGLSVVPEREDECILCAKCIELAPHAVTVRRAYGSRAALAGSSQVDA
jgi:NAD-dependent dihydropyrimidine dehydrogenase PreA subunit